MDFQSKKQCAEAMHRCPKCRSLLVQPLNMHADGGDHWDVELRCPDCEWRWRGSYSRAQVDRYIHELDRGDRELMEDLRALVRANMEEEANRFAAALATDGILPDDFRAGRRTA